MPAGGGPATGTEPEGHHMRLFTRKTGGDTETRPGRRRLRRVVPAMLAAALGAGLAVAGTATPAQAALAGTVIPAETGGLITDARMFSAATVSEACPEHYQSRIGVYAAVDGYEQYLAASVTAGAPYAGAPFTFGMPETGTRSLASRIGTDADGTHQIRVRCLPAAGDTAHPVDPALYFTFHVEVTGDRWELVQAAPESTRMSLTASPARQVVTGEDYTLTARVRPAGAEGTVRFTSGSRILGTAPVTDGTATLGLRAPAVPGALSLSAEFYPADAAEHSFATRDLTYHAVSAPAIEVTDAAGTPLAPGAEVAAGSRLTVTAEGFRADEHVLAVVRGDGLPWLTLTTADGTGTVTGATVRVPGYLPAGPHTLTLTGLSGGTTVSFPFTVG
jgi:hypothetical protein